MPILHPTYINTAIASMSKTMRNNRNMLLTGFGKIEHTLKADNTIVTQMDADLEYKLTEILQGLDKDVGILGEELGQYGSKDVYWLLDPIDGTEQYVRGLSGCVNMACLIENDVPMVSIIYDFIHDELYVAQKDQGATKNGKSIHVSNRPLDRSWIEFAIRKNQDQLLPTLMKLAESCNIVRLRNSLLVSCGNIEGIVVVDGKGGLWDYVPRVLMIQEAGGKAANIGSTSYSLHNSSFIASNPVVFDELQRIMS